jgi:phage shock protein PspC (stress-responsive transcriptional regulator)
MLRRFIFSHKYLKMAFIVLVGSFFLAIICTGFYHLMDNSGYEKSEPSASQTKQETATVQKPEPTSVSQVMKEHRLVRIPDQGMVGGVLAGFAYYFSIPLWLLRVIVVLIVLLTDDIAGFIILLYILCWIFMPAINFMPADFLTITG